MSAFRIGAGSLQPVRTRADSLPQQFLAAVGALVKWLPGEVVAGYAATVVMMQPHQPETGPAKPPDVSWAPWIVALVATPAFVLLGALYANNMKKLVARIILSLPAFILWSASVPHSAWDNIDGFKNNHAVFLFVLLLVTSAFTTIAELVTRE